MNTNDIGRLLVARRKALGLNQQSLGDLVGVAVHTICNIESGKGNPTVETLNRLLEPLGLELVIRVRKPRVDS